MTTDDDNQGSTKVYYYLDGNTPFVSTIDVPVNKITLGDFKSVFKKQNYKYFCKQFDPVLNKEVKVELTNDNHKLNKSENGLVKMALLAISNLGSKNGGTLPRTKGIDVTEDCFKVKSSLKYL